MTSVTTRMVEFAANRGTAPGYLAHPTGDGPFPGVVVIQEWWGLKDHIKGVADRLAGKGYCAIAPDLYHGAVATEPDEARKLAMMLDREQAILDIQGAVDYLLAQPFVMPKRTGVIGFCMGGGLAAMMALKGTNIGAVVVFYGGRGILDEESIEAISVPFLGLYGGKDTGMPPDMVMGWDDLMTAHNKPHDIIIYPDAGHAFFNEGRPEAYNKAASDDAWKRTLEWLGKYLV